MCVRIQDTCSGRAPIHYAVEAENFILVNFLLENSCDVNAPTYSGNTPLHIAAGRRLKEIVALLMAYGANPALANGEGDFPSDLPASLLVRTPTESQITYRMIFKCSLHFIRRGLTFT